MLSLFFWSGRQRGARLCLKTFTQCLDSIFRSGRPTLCLKPAGLLFLFFGGGDAVVSMDLKARSVVLELSETPAGQVTNCVTFSCYVLLVLGNQGERPAPSLAHVEGS